MLLSSDALWRRARPVWIREPVEMRMRRPAPPSAGLLAFAPPPRVGLSWISDAAEDAARDAARDAERSMSEQAGKLSDDVERELAQDYSRRMSEDIKNNSISPDEARMQSEPFSEDLARYGEEGMRSRGFMDADGNPTQKFIDERVPVASEAINGGANTMEGTSQSNAERSAQFGEDLKDRANDQEKTDPCGTDRCAETKQALDDCEGAEACEKAFEDHQEARGEAGKTTAAVDEATSEIISRESRKGWRGFGKGSLKWLRRLLIFAGGLASVAILAELLVGNDGGTCTVKSFPSDEKSCESVPNLVGKDLVTSASWVDGKCKLNYADGKSASDVLAALNNCQTDATTGSAKACPKEVLWTIDEDNLVPFPANQKDCNHIASILSADSGVFADGCCTLRRGQMSPENCCGAFCFASCSGATCDDASCSALRKGPGGISGAADSALGRTQCACYRDPSVWDKIRNVAECVPPVGLFTGCYSNWLTKWGKIILYVVCGIILLSIIIGIVVFVVRNKARSDAVRKGVEAALVRPKVG